MLAIRLARVGRKNVKNFRIVVSEKTKHPQRGALDIIGEYNPEAEPHTLSYDKEKLLSWISKGAQPSETLARLLVKDGLSEMQKYYDPNKKFNRPKKGEEETPEKAPAPSTEQPKEASEKPAKEEDKKEPEKK